MGLAPNSQSLVDLKLASSLGESLAEELLFLIPTKPNSSDSKTIQEYQKLNPSVPYRFLEGKEINAREILNVCQAEAVDLLLILAEPKEGLKRYYMGSLARQLLKRANCSCLLFSPSISIERPARSMVLRAPNHPKTKDSLLKTLELAKSFNCREINIAVEGDLAEFQDQNWYKVISEPEKISGDLDFHLAKIENKGGYSIANYVESQGSHFLVVNSPDTRLGYRDRVIEDDLEYLLSEMPSHILLVHSQENF